VFVSVPISSPKLVAFFFFYCVHMRGPVPLRKSFYFFIVLLFSLVCILMNFFFTHLTCICLLESETHVSSLSTLLPDLAAGFEVVFSSSFWHSGQRSHRLSPKVPPPNLCLSRFLLFPVFFCFFWRSFVFFSERCLFKGPPSPETHRNLFQFLQLPSFCSIPFALSPAFFRFKTVIIKARTLFPTPPSTHETVSGQLNGRIPVLLFLFLSDEHTLHEFSRTLLSVLPPPNFSRSASSYRTRTHFAQTIPFVGGSRLGISRWRNDQKGKVFPVFFFFPLALNFDEPPSFCRVRRQLLPEFFYFSETTLSSRLTVGWRVPSAVFQTPCHLRRRWFIFHPPPLGTLFQLVFHHFFSLQFRLW